MAKATQTRVAPTAPTPTALPKMAPTADMFTAPFLWTPVDFARRGRDTAQDPTTEVWIGVGQYNHEMDPVVEIRLFGVGPHSGEPILTTVSGLPMKDAVICYVCLDNSPTRSSHGAWLSTALRWLGERVPGGPSTLSSTGLGVAARSACIGNVLSGHVDAGPSASTRA